MLILFHRLLCHKGTSDVSMVRANHDVTMSYDVVLCFIVTIDYTKYGSNLQNYTRIVYILYFNQPYTTYIMD